MKKTIYLIKLSDNSIHCAFDTLEAAIQERQSLFDDYGQYCSAIIELPYYESNKSELTL